MVWRNWEGFQNTTFDIQLMHVLGWIMVLIFLYVFFVPYRGLKQGIAAADYPLAGRHLGRIRILVAINTTLGIIVAVVASARRYL